MGSAAPIRQKTRRGASFNLRTTTPAPRVYCRTDSATAQGAPRVSALDDRRNRLAVLNAGPIADADASSVASLLADCWELLSGSDAGGMTADKLMGRTENLIWRSPLLEFTIERHGGTVIGSTRAELQTWIVNANDGSASLSEGGHRQLRPAARKLNVRPIAAGMATIVQQLREDSRLKWGGENRVSICMAAVIPATNKETTTGRSHGTNTSLFEISVPLLDVRQPAAPTLVNVVRSYPGHPLLMGPGCK